MFWRMRRFHPIESKGSLLDPCQMSHDLHTDLAHPWQVCHFLLPKGSRIHLIHEGRKVILHLPWSLRPQRSSRVMSILKLPEHYWTKETKRRGDMMWDENLIWYRAMRCHWERASSLYLNKLGIYVTWCDMPIWCDIVLIHDTTMRNEQNYWKTPWVTTR